MRCTGHAVADGVYGTCRRCSVSDATRASTESVSVCVPWVDVMTDSAMRACRAVPRKRGAWHRTHRIVLYKQ